MSGLDTPYGRVMSKEEMEPMLNRMGRPMPLEAVAEEGLSSPNELHGGESATKAVQAGLPFKGMAAKMEVSVAEELASQGHEEMMRKAAVRLETAARLYWQAVLSAADAGHVDRLHSYVARFGWLQAKAISAWSEVRRGSRRGAPSLRELLGDIGDVLNDNAIQGPHS